MRSVQHGPVVVVRFDRYPTPAIERAVDALTLEAHEACGEPITFVAILPEPADAPPSLFRDRLETRSRDSRHVTSSVHLVIEGDEPAAKLRRSAISALAHHAHGYRLKVHARAERALIAAGAERSLDPSPLFEAAREAGVLPARVGDGAQAWYGTGP
ncbi:MAG: hypothetical protein JNK82_10250 [Myxococcaceae bacterium]|nr:hypothetical protein [Myxococcaceae bacterium]